MKTIQKYNKKLLIFAILGATLVSAALGFHFVNAINTQAEDSSSGALQPIVKEESKVTAEAAATQEVAKAEEKKKTEEKQAAAKAATAAAASASASTPAPAAPAYVSVPTAAPQVKKVYNDAASKAGRPIEIAGQPTGIWLGGWVGNIQGAANQAVSAAGAQGSIALLVLYNIPNRDCGSYSAGGAANSEGYRAWIRSVAAGIGAREALVILEPDALPQITDCLSEADQAIRYADLSYAVTTLSTQTKAFVYLDAGNSSWHSAVTMISRLEKANVAQARGFSLNVSGFQTSASSQTYGEAISSKLKKSYVIDSSRNGQGPKGSEWCNPAGRGLGKKPAIVTSGNLDAYLWIKIPGESDGSCNGAPAAGTWWEDYAQELIRNAVY